MIFFFFYFMYTLVIWAKVVVAKDQVIVDNNCALLELSQLTSIIERKLNVRTGRSLLFFAFLLWN